MNALKNPDHPKRPNLFDFATSELSQDAFLAWLISWAHYHFHDKEPELHQIALNFVKELLFDPEQPNKFTELTITSLEVNTQEKRIDVHAIVNETYFILIEDKKGTKEHSDQLNQYVKKIKNDRKYDQLAIKRVYFKMEEQSDMTGVDGAEFNHFDRKKMLTCLRPYASATRKNSILSDFLESLEAIDKDYNSFKETKLEAWSGRAWKGFFAHLQKELGNGCNWDYIPNQSGGFIGLWWRPFSDIPVFLQLNQARLVFRMDAEVGIPNRDQLRKSYQKLILEADTKMNLTYFGQKTEALLPAIKR
jgi:hypothetical protein